MTSRTTQRRAATTAPVAAESLPALMTRRMIAEYLHVAERSVSRWIQEGRLPARRTTHAGSGRVLVRREDVLALIGGGA